VSNESEQISSSTHLRQDNRDVRRERAVKGEELDYIFMIASESRGRLTTINGWRSTPPPTSPTAR